MVDSQQSKLLRELRSEILLLKEHIEKQTRHTEVLENKLRKALTDADDVAITIEIGDPIEPSSDGTSLRSNRDAYNDDTIAFPDEADRGAREQEVAWWPRVARGGAVLTANPGWRNFSLHRRIEKIIGVSVCELPPAIIGQIVKSVADQQERLQDFIPIFLTDVTDFEVFRRFGFVFEYFPGKAARAQYAGTIDWAEYARRRRELVEKKWGIVQTISFGTVEFGRISSENKIPANDGEAASTQQSATILSKPAKVRKARITKIRPVRSTIRRRPKV